VPSFGAPTMSLDEFADREMARAMAAEEASKAPEGMVPSRRYSELYAAGEEDNEALVDEATLKDRDWDNWKDENKKGSGNKANKRF
jgi:immunoglobulin-binding protein 1